MNELRRKLVLSSPLLTVGFFTGCGGGENRAAGGDADKGRAFAQATATSPGQTLAVSVAPNNLFVDDIWWNSEGGGFNFVPSSIPLLQAVINGGVLHISLVERVNVSSTVKITKSLSVTLAQPSSGLPLAVNSIYPINATNAAQVRILKRTTNGSSITDDTFAYSPSAVGTVKIVAVTPVANGDPLYKLTFSGVRFQAAGGSAIKPFVLSGDTTLSTPTETAAWV